MTYLNCLQTRSRLATLLTLMADEVENMLIGFKLLPTR